jgi:cell division protein FtsL
MTRLNVLLLLALIASSLYLVRVSYDARRHFTLLDRAKSEARQLDSDYERLKTEQQSQATPLRVEKTAREKLAMRSASPNVTHYVSRGASAPTTGNTPPEVR